MLHRIKAIAKKKSVILLASLAAVSGTVYEVSFNKTAEPTRYVLAAVSRGTLVTSVSGSGQVTGLNQIEVKPEVSGRITNVHVTSGQAVKSGDPLIEIENAEAHKTIRDVTQQVNDARLSISSSELSLKKLRQPPDAVALVQARNALAQSRRAVDELKQGPDELDVKQAENDLAIQLQNLKMSYDGSTPTGIRNAYDNAVSTLKSVTQTLQQSLYDADTVLGIDNASANDTYEKLLSVQDSSRLPLAVQAYPAAMQAAAALKLRTDALKTTGEPAANVDSALADAQTAIGLVDPFLQKVYDVLMATIASASFSQASLDGLRSINASDRSGVSSKLISLISQGQSIEQAKQSYDSARLSVEKSKIALEKLKRGADASDLAAAQERVAETEAALAKLLKGTDSLDIASAENSLAQKRSALVAVENKLADAREALADYTVRAPFDGMVAKITANVAEQASPSAAAVTLQTQAKIAQISLNEVDVAKVKNGQKATLTFDAIPDLTIAGTVSEVDPLGTASQGVVTYSVKVAFVTQDDRIKAGMSATASIVTDLRQNVLLAPNAAVKRDINGAAVQLLANVSATSAASDQGVASSVPPESRAIQIGLANDQQTEVTGGLNEGDYVVTRTIDPAAAATKTATNQSASAIRLPGITGGSGNAGFRSR